MKFCLRDRNQGMVDAWKFYFNDNLDFHISCGDIFDDGPHMTVDAIVSPANSFGFMDGGIDYVYSEFLGWGMSEDLRKAIHVDHGGELLVGDAVVVDIRDSNPKTPIPYLISAPTMRVPLDIRGTVNAYLAFRAVLRASKKYDIKSILCPGLGTAVGKLPHKVAALQMHAAYRQFTRPEVMDVLGRAHARHHFMLNPEAYDMTLKAHG